MSAPLAPAAASTALVPAAASAHPLTKYEWQSAEDFSRFLKASPKLRGVDVHIRQKEELDEALECLRCQPGQIQELKFTTSVEGCEIKIEFTIQFLSKYASVAGIRRVSFEAPVNMGATAWPPYKVIPLTVSVQREEAHGGIGEFLKEGGSPSGNERQVPCRSLTDSSLDLALRGQDGVEMPIQWKFKNSGCENKPSLSSFPFNDWGRLTQLHPANGEELVSLWKSDPDTIPLFVAYQACDTEHLDAPIQNFALLGNALTTALTTMTNRKHLKLFMAAAASDPFLLCFLFELEKRTPHGIKDWDVFLQKLEGGTLVEGRESELARGALGRFLKPLHSLRIGDISIQLRTADWKKISRMECQTHFAKMLRALSAYLQFEELVLEFFDTEDYEIFHGLIPQVFRGISLKRLMLISKNSPYGRDMKMTTMTWGQPI